MSEYGCHAYDEVGEICVLDLGYPDCPGAEYRSRLKGHCKEACFHWRPVAETVSDAPDSDAQAELSRAYALIEKMREALTACQISIGGNVRAVRLSVSALEEAEAFLAERVK